MTPLDTTPALSAGAAGTVIRCAVLPAIVLALAACWDDAPSPTAPASAVSEAKGGAPGKPGSAGTVLFAGYRDGNMDIYAMNPDGSNLRRLTTDTAFDIHPDFAPDNRKFVFVRYSDVNHSELWTASADGNRQTQLTNFGGFLTQPRYSPDGSKIAFAGYVSGQGYEIFTINADGTGLTRLTELVSDEKTPAWSPDGQKIAYQSDIADKDVPSIFVMAADGSDKWMILQCYNAGCSEPAYSPVGNKIAVTDNANGSVFVLDVDRRTTAPVGPISPGGRSSHPTWNTDGTQVLFASSRGIEGTYEIYAGTPGNLDASSVRRLTLFSPGNTHSPSFSH